MMAGFRAILGYLLPSWARTDEADGALAWTLAALVDVQLERVRSGVLARFPTRAGMSALARIGKDRLITRGRSESDASYAARLLAWRYPRGHRVRGNIFALLDQIQAYFGRGFALWGIDRAGNKRTLSASGAASYLRGYAWTWDSLASTLWARQWIVLDGSTLFAGQPDWGDPALWGGSFGDRSYCIGVHGASADDWSAVVALTRGQHRWLPAGVRGEWIIVSLDGTAPTPDATWSTWGEFFDGGGGYTYYLPTRHSYVTDAAQPYRFVAMRAALHDHAGEAVWASRMVTSLGTVHAPDAVLSIMGDETDFPTTITMPDSSSVAGAALFPATITLPDDGDIP